jgi:hypothetical protein
MRWTALAVLVLVAGCGGGEKKHAETTSTPAPTVKTTKPKPQAKPPKYFPSASHKHRPPGSIYNDEVGENVLTAPYDRIIELFGPPASRHGKCIKYKIVERPSDMWTFCFRGQKMVSASG